MHVAAKVAIGVGVAGAVGAAIAYAVTRKSDPQDMAYDQFLPFDRNRDGNIQQGEVTRFEVGRPYTRDRQILFRNGDWVSWRQDIVHDETTSSMQRAWLGAKGNDAVASVEELTKLVMSFDRDGDGKLGFSERGDFNDMYGVTNQRRTIIDNTEYGTTYDPLPRR